MNKKLLCILIFILLSVLMLPELFSALKIEKLNMNVICSIKLPALNDEVISTLTDNSVKHTKYLVLDDSLFIDPQNGEKIYILDKYGYSFGVSMDLSAKTAEWYTNLKNSIDKYSVETFYLEDKNTGFNDETYRDITALAKNNGIIVGLLENAQQNGLQYGSMLTLSELKGISDRALSVYPSDINGISEDDLKYRLLRSVVDRGIRYIYIEASEKNNLIKYDNVYSSLFQELSNKGYGSLEGTVVKTYENNILKASTAVLFSIFQVFVFLYLLGINKKHIKYYTGMFILAVILLLTTSYNSAMLFIAFSITATVPVSSTLMLFMQPNGITILQMFKCLFITFLIYLLSGCFIWLALSGYDFRTGFVTYKLAIPSFALPLIIILYYVFKSRNVKFEDIKKAFNKRLTIVITLLTIFVVYIYLSRSSNYSLLPASYPELKFRILLEDYTAARPRLKEFLFGYPCFFLFFQLDKEKSKILQIYLLLGASIIGISILNTFCHSFTPVYISLVRAFSGFVLGTFTAGTLCFLVNLLSKSAFKSRLRYGLSNSRNR